MYNIIKYNQQLTDMKHMLNSNANLKLPNGLWSILNSKTVLSRTC